MGPGVDRAGFRGLVWACGKLLQGQAVTPH